MTASPLEFALRVAAVLNELAIPYALGGSVASSMLGEPRATMDIDVAIALTADQVDDLTNAFRGDFYMPEQAARQAVASHGSFNLISNTTPYKVDLFVLGDTELDQLQLQRRVSIEVGSNDDERLWVTSPADQILRKLDWYRQTGRTSERQWRDVMGLLDAHHNNIDIDDLHRVATNAGLDDLVTQALAEVDYQR